MKVEVEKVKRTSPNRKEQRLLRKMRRIKLHEKRSIQRQVRKSPVRKTKVKLSRRLLKKGEEKAEMKSGVSYSL